MTKQPWKKVSEKTLLTHPRITVYEDEVELPSGESIQYVRFADGENSGCAIAVNDEGKILLQKEYSYPPNDWLYQFPGGGISEADPAAGVARELAEEASLAADSWESLGWFYPDNRRRASKFYVYLATGLHPDNSAQQDNTEEFEDFWFTESEIDQMMVEGQIVNYATLAAWGFYKARQSHSV